VKTNLKKVRVEQQARIWVEAGNISKVKEPTQVPILITGPGAVSVEVFAVIDPLKNIDPKVKGYIESNGHLAIEAGNFSRLVANDERSWQKIPHFGRTHSGIQPVPVNMAGMETTEMAACVEYDLQLNTDGEAIVYLVLAPTLNIYNNEGLRVGISFNDAEPQILNMHNWQGFRDWEESVRTNTVVLKSNHLLNAGKNTLKIWAVDPATVLQRIISDTGGLKPSYLGPKESYVIKK
jgi:hypothetical protein